MENTKFPDEILDEMKTETLRIENQELIGINIY